MSQQERPDWMEPEPEQEVPPEFGRRLRGLQEEAARRQGEPSPQQQLDELKAYLLGTDFRDLLTAALADVEEGGALSHPENHERVKASFLPHAHAIQADLKEHLG